MSFDSKFKIQNSKLFLLLSFSFLIILFYSCENKIEQQKEIEERNHVDPFRDNVLRIRRAGLLAGISDKELDSLITVCEKDSLNGLKNILVKSGELLQLDVSVNKEKDALKVYDEICKTIGNKYPDLKSDSVVCRYLPEDPGGKDTGWVLMKQYSGKDVFTKKLYFLQGEPFDETFCKLYNTRLAAEKKDYRFFLITFMCTDCYNEFYDSKIKPDIRTTGILKLSKAQADSLKTIDQLSIDPDDEFTVFTPEETEMNIKQFESTGILQKNDSAWWRERKTEMRESTIYGKEDVYDFLDTIFCTVNFDTMMAYNPYEQMLKDMSAVSRGKFTPAGILDEEQNSTSHTVHFTVKNKVYEVDAEQKNGINDPALVDKVNEALDEQKIGGAFYTVLSRDNRMLMIYLDDKTAEKAKASGFFSEFTKGASQDLKNRYAGPSGA